MKPCLTMCPSVVRFYGLVNTQARSSISSYPDNLKHNLWQGKEDQEQQKYQHTLEEAVTAADIPWDRDGRRGPQQEPEVITGRLFSKPYIVLNTDQNPKSKDLSPKIDHQRRRLNMGEHVAGQHRRGTGCDDRQRPKRSEKGTHRRWPEDEGVETEPRQMLLGDLLLRETSLSPRGAPMCSPVRDGQFSGPNSPLKSPFWQRGCEVQFLSVSISKADGFGM